jgi:carbon storage regulator
MLILTRRVKETLLIGDDIQVVILGIKGNQVSIGIEAPRELTILREELVPRHHAESEGEI